MIATKAVSQTCAVPSTGVQPLDHFFPSEGTPVDVTRENQDPTAPLPLANDGDLTVISGRSEQAAGQVIYIRGKVQDQNCIPIQGANLIVWQASASGRYNHQGDQSQLEFRHPETGELIRREMYPSFQYWGKAVSDENGDYLFKTVVPGFYPADMSRSWYRPPHIHFMVSALGFEQFVTQLYFNIPSLVENEWIQNLNRKDLLLQSQNFIRRRKGGTCCRFHSEYRVF